MTRDYPSPDYSASAMRSVLRALSIFDCFSAEKTRLTLHEVTEMIGLPKSTVLRMLRTLESAGYLVRLDDQRYSLSFRFTRLAGLVSETLDIRTLARPSMIDLAKLTGETVTLNTVSGPDRVCLDVVDATSALRGAAKPGAHVPLRAGSANRTLLAFMPATELKPLLTDICRATRQSRATLLKDLEKVRRAGHAVSHGERVPGLSAISAPVRDQSGQVRYSLSIIGPTLRFRSNGRKFIPLVVDAANQISRRYTG